MFRSEINKARTVLLIAGLLGVLFFIAGCKDRGESAMEDSAALSKDEILAIANDAARDHDIYPERCEVDYDAAWSQWQETVEFLQQQSGGGREEFEEFLGRLSERDHVIVRYWPKNPNVIGGGLWLFIDKKTGKVIGHYDEM